MDSEYSGAAEARDRLRKNAKNEATCIVLNGMLKDAQGEIVRMREENERLAGCVNRLKVERAWAIREAKRLTEENERLRGWIRVEGGCNNTCTRKILGETCGYCRCPQSKTDAARSAK